MESKLEEEITRKLISKGNEQVVNWIKSCSPEDIFYLLADNLTFAEFVDLYNLMTKPLIIWKYEK